MITYHNKAWNIGPVVEASLTLHGANEACGSNSALSIIGNICNFVGAIKN